MSVKLETIVSLCKRRGFIFQSSEIYGGMTACYDYGPLGVELKRNVRDAWWRAMVHERDDVEGIECSILMHPDVWRTSGHASRGRRTTCRGAPVVGHWARTSTSSPMSSRTTAVTRSSVSPAAAQHAVSRSSSEPPAIACLPSSAARST